jgi:predicted aspartyl protease
MPDRSYLARRNAVDPTKPCLISKFATVPVKVIYGTAYVPVKVNGVTTVGILDTGSEDTVLSTAIVAAAKLTIDPKQRPRRYYGVAGSFSISVVQANTMQIGELELRPPFPSYVFDFIGSSTDKIGTIIGMNSIDHLDWDLDFVHEKMTSFRTMNCQDIDPLWDTKSTGLPLTRGTNPHFSDIANLLAISANFTIPVAFDGGIVEAMFDTGARQSFMTREGAHKAGITNAELDADPIAEIRAINGKKRKVRLHRVAEMVVGEDIVHDFPLNVAEYLNRDNDFDMILGMDWIAKHRIWLSFTTDSVYVDSGEKKPPNWAPTPKL